MTCAQALPDCVEDGLAGVAELARPCAALWAAALGKYYGDAQAYRQRGTAPDDGEAWRDLTGSRELLGNICDIIDADPQRLGDAMIQALDAGLTFRASAMNRSVVELVEDYSGCSLAGKVV